MLPWGAWGGGSGIITTSSDGITWYTQPLIFTDNIRGIAYGGGIFVAVGDNGQLGTSPNGTTWTMRGSNFGTTQINDVAYGGGLFVIVGNSGTLAVSSAGINALFTPITYQSL